MRKMLITSRSYRLSRLHLNQPYRGFYQSFQTATTSTAIDHHPDQKLSQNNHTNTLSELQSQLKLHTQSKDLIALLGTCRSIKEHLHQPSSITIQQAYYSLINLLGHYGLWTQIHLLIKELDQRPDLLNTLTADLHFWSLLFSAFINCGKAPDVLLSRLSENGFCVNQIPPILLEALIQASITENNLSQCLFCFRQYLLRLSDTIKPNRSLISRLTRFFAQNGELRLAIDLTNKYLLPIAAEEKELINSLIVLLRASVDRSDPDSTLYCYHHLSESHAQALSQTLDEGFSLSLLSLSYRHMLPALSLKIVSELVGQKIELGLPHLLPTLGVLCRTGGGRMKDVIQLLGRMSRTKVYDLVSDEDEWLEYHLVIGHLGGLTEYRKLITTNPSIHQPPSNLSHPSSRSHLDNSLRFAESLLNSPELIGSVKCPIILTILINSLLQSFAELEEHEEVLKTCERFFGSSNTFIVPNERTAEITEKAREALLNNTTCEEATVL
ncbi:hypothetical protein DFH28DRAFT_284314 [Melampsora americana]|nr:hypothetical protein DFH28DRAFT_284314 [Melampsora americana]